MYKIALICEHGASTGMCVQKMIEASAKLGIECKIGAHSAANFENIANEMDSLLFGPQLAYRLEPFKKKYPEYAKKMSVINSMDFGMMDGEKILKNTIALIEGKS